MTGGLLSLVIFPLIGFALSRLAGEMQPYLAGAGIVGATLFVAAVLHLPMELAFAALAAGSLIVIFLQRTAAMEEIRSLASQAKLYPVLPTVIALVAAVWLLAVTAITPLRDYDGRAFWVLKAKAIAIERSIDGPFFHGATDSPRREYPLLVPIDAAVLMRLGGSIDDVQVRWLYSLLAIAFALTLRHRLGRLVSPAAGAWSAALFLWLPQILVEIEGGATSAYADIAVGAFVACAFFELLEKEGSPLRFGFWIAFVSLTKSEGLPLALLLLAVATFVWRRRALVSAIPLAVTLSALIAWRSGIERSDELDFATLVLRLPNYLDAFWSSITGLAAQLVALHDWGLLWIAVLAGAVILVRQRRWRGILLAASVTLPMLLLYAAVFAVSEWHISVMTDNLAPRVLTHILGPALYVFSAGVFAAEERGA